MFDFPELRPDFSDTWPWLELVLRRHDGSFVSRATDWAPARADLLRRWGEVIGPFPARVPLEVRIEREEELPDHRRALLTYQADAKTRTTAYVLSPLGDSRTLCPGAVVLHQTSDTTIEDPVGLAGRESMHIALRLVKRGYVCIAPRNFLWATPGATPNSATKLILESDWKTGMAKMTWDAIRAVDLLAARADIDAGRIGCIGHSLGGKESLYLAAFDPRVRASVSCEGGVGIAYSNWDDPWYLGDQVHAASFGLDHHQLIALIAPRAFLLVGGHKANPQCVDGVWSWPYLQANLPLWQLLNAEGKLGLLLHYQGHDFPAPGAFRDKVHNWLDWNLSS